MVIVRDWLRYTSTAREAERVVREGKIVVDGRPVREPRFPIGLMDVIEVPDTEEKYRVLPFYRRGLGLLEIEGTELGFKLGLIVRKHHVKGGALQFTLHDGRNVLIKAPTEKDRAISTHDVFKLELPSGKVMAHLPFSAEKYGLIFRGSRMGLHGPILSFEEVRRYPAKQLVTVHTPEGIISTVLGYVMVVGEDRPWLKLP